MQNLMFLSLCVCVIMCVLEQRSSSWEWEASYLHGSVILIDKWVCACVCPLLNDKALKSKWVQPVSDSYSGYRAVPEAYSGLGTCTHTHTHTDRYTHTLRYQTPLLNVFLLVFLLSAFMEVNGQINGLVWDFVVRQTIGSLLVAYTYTHTHTHNYTKRRPNTMTCSSSETRDFPLEKL